MPEVSFAVILTHDVRQAEACLRSLRAQELDSEILLVLNDVDADMRALAQAVERGRIVHDGSDLGAVLGWNVALREAHADHVCIVHEDSELRAGCARRLLTTLRERPDAAAVSPRNVATDGTGDYYGCVIWADGTTSVLTEAIDPNGPYPIDYGPSACLMLDRAAAIGVGGFDVRVSPAIYVDASLACAVWSAGRTVLCDPRAVNVHHRAAMVDPAQGERRGRRFRRFLWERNHRRFQAGWAEFLHGQAAPPEDRVRPDPAEIAVAVARIRAREERARAVPAAPAPSTLDVPADLDRAAERLRRHLEDEFIASLVESEASLETELENMHRRYAEQHAELQRVHREYAALWDDRERLRALAGSPRR